MWRGAMNQIYKLEAGKNRKIYSDFTIRGCSKIAGTEVPESASRSKANLNNMFRSKPCSLALPVDSPLRFVERKHTGIKRIIFNLLMASGKDKSLEHANLIYYHRVLPQVDRPAIYNVFNLEKTFQTNLSLLILHMWLILHRLKQEGEEGNELGQIMYDVYIQDIEPRISMDCVRQGMPKLAVSYLITKYAQDVEKIFYGNVIAYETALLPEAEQDELQSAIWSNVFSHGSLKLNDAEVQAMSRYVRRESSCLSLTEKEAMFTGNFMFTPLENPIPFSDPHEETKK